VDLLKKRGSQITMAMAMALFLLCLTICACQVQPPAPTVPEAEDILQLHHVPDEKYIYCIHYDEKAFQKAIDKAAPYNIEGSMLAATSPHFLPVMSFTANILYTLAELKQPPVTIFVVAPNHSGEGFPIMLADKGWATPYGNLEIDKTATAAILESPPLANKIDIDLQHIQSDHSAATLMPFIKYYLPDVQVVTLLLSKDCRLEQLRILAKIIFEISQEKPIFVLGSIDFSHYLPIEETAKRDELTEVLIQAGDIQAIMGLDSGNLDSPPSMVTLINYAANFPFVIAQRLEHVILAESATMRDIGYSYSVYVYSYTNI